uniref:Uncharacterized protein n=1 Tax=Mesocestoides corti TaxID=53468 RepID=A0A5K3FRC9_MESCO
MIGVATVGSGILQLRYVWAQPSRTILSSADFLPMYVPMAYEKGQQPTKNEDEKEVLYNGRCSQYGGLGLTTNDR